MPKSQGKLGNNLKCMKLKPQHTRSLDTAKVHTYRYIPTVKYTLILTTAKLYTLRIHMC